MAERGYLARYIECRLRNRRPRLDDKYAVGMMKANILSTFLVLGDSAAQTAKEIERLIERMGINHEHR